MSFRYVQTFGQTETGYLEDNNHFYDVRGIGMDGNNIWIADSWGNRVLKFDASGNFLQKIGKASFREATGTSLDYISDVAADASGNVWVVDGGAEHVVKFSSTGQRLSELGSAYNAGSTNDRFDEAFGIAFDSAGNVYVSDSHLWDDYGNQRVQVFNSSGNYLATIGVTGASGGDNSHFHSPRHIAIYGSYLYVADAANDRVQILDISNPAAATYVGTLGVSGVSGSDNGHLNYPEGVAVDANYIYVADSSNDRVQIFNRAGLTYVATLGTGYGTANSSFNHPCDIAVDAAGTIFVADTSNERVQQFNSGRAYVRTYGTTGVPYLTDGYHYNYPADVAVAGDGSIYIVEERGHRLIKLNAAGQPQWTVGQPGVAGSDNAHLFGPEGVAVDSSGRVYVTVSWSNPKVQIFNGDGTYYATLGTGYGTGNYQFNHPFGVTIDKNGNIYVADTNNHRVQIYNSSRTYLATLGQTGVPGSDNAHFSYPRDVGVDSAGNIYVVDLNNHRVQVFNSSRAYVRTIGESGVAGSDFGHLSNPTGIAVDGNNRIYVSDGWGWRVQVFDSTGAYLTTIGGSTGNATGQLRQAQGLAIDSPGNLYIADYLNQRIQKFTPGVPGWLQININGFGNSSNYGVTSLTPFNGFLYAGTFNPPPTGTHAEVWRWGGGAWSLVKTNGFGDTMNAGVDHLLVFNGNLYASTWNQEFKNYTSTGGQIWRSPNGNTWSQVVSAGFGDSTNSEIFRMGVFNNQIYASTWSYTTTHGAEIWRSGTGNSLDWTRVVSNGFGDPNT
ncbi:MAG: SMP-30/gluconolactonase/LRE family protein [Chloroflexi bacterium]|nr:SMP-30/gluconolactonase/LRE family protein [Chloroflexota bacterium]